MAQAEACTNTSFSRGTGSSILGHSVQRSFRGPRHVREDDSEVWIVGHCCSQLSPSSKQAKALFLSPIHSSWTGRRLPVWLPRLRRIRSILSVSGHPLNNNPQYLPAPQIATQKGNEAFVTSAGLSLGDPQRVVSLEASWRETAHHRFSPCHLGFRANWHSTLPERDRPYSKTLEPHCLKRGQKLLNTQWIPSGPSWPGSYLPLSFMWFSCVQSPTVSRPD